jgi:hypothetical protein
MEPFDYFEALRGCPYLFLEELTELESDTLRIRVVEGITSDAPEPIEVAAPSLGEGFPLRVTAEFRRYEVVWHCYVLYQLTNESFAKVEMPSDRTVAASVAALDSSNLLEYIAHSTRAPNECPGKLTHYQIICSDHIVDVVSAQRPDCQRIAPVLKVN